MNWISIWTIIAFVTSFLVLMQGLSILLGVGKKDEEIKIIGFLTVSLAALGILLNVLFLSTDIAVSPEFGVVIIQGQWANFFFSLALLGLLLCLSLGWDLARLRAGWKSGRKWLYLVSCGVWLVSILPNLFMKANAGIPGEVPIFLYDIWWPPSLVWMLIGFIDIALTILRVRQANDLPWMAMVIASGVVFVFLVIYSIWFPNDFAHPWTLGVWVLTEALLVFLFVFLGVIYLVRRFSSRPEADRELPARSSFFGELKSSLGKITRQQVYLLLALGTIGIGLVILLFGSSIVGHAPLVGPGPGIFVLLLGWGITTELVTDGWFHTLRRSYQQGNWFIKDGPIDAASTRLKTSAKGFGGFLGSIFTFPKHWTALIKLVLLVVLLVVVNDFLNHGKTIIQPFQAIGFDDTATLAASADDRLVNDLVLLNQQLQPVLIFPNSSGMGDKELGYVQAGSIDSSIDAALNNSGGLDFGTIKIPTDVLIAPVQDLTRPLTRIRIVNGSIISNGEGYILLANTSDGSAWIAQSTQEGKLDLPQAIPGLVEELAFRMISSDEEVLHYGFTKDWGAFQSFKAGLEKFQIYQSRQDYDALTSAIENFRDAAVQDTRFALAYYRLGLALQENRQPHLAEAALRTGLDLNPDSVPLRNALAYHLYYFNWYLPTHPAVVLYGESPNLGVKNRQARLLWHQIVSLPSAQVLPADRASAYLGLCNDALDHRGEGRNQEYLAYFYCFKAHTLIERLPRDQQSQDKIRQAEAEALNNLGVIIDGIGSSTSKQITGWFCQQLDPATLESGEGLEWSYHPAYARASLSYYEAAIALQPRDNVIRCNAAIAAMLLGHEEQMQALNESAQAHYDLARQYLYQARTESSNQEGPSPYFKAALQEYQKVIRIDPTHISALNEYAYTYWVFRLRWPDEDLEILGKDPVDKLAESYAHEAVRLAEIQHDNYLKVLSTSTLAEVFITQGKFEEAEKILRELFEGEDPSAKISIVPDSYIFDEVRWELAQVSRCLSLEDPANGEMKKQADDYLQTIKDHENKLETYVFSYTGKKLLTNDKDGYYLPFCSPERSTQ